MAIKFFNSWPLWQKMTFVLGVAILTVFGIGYGKLLWTTRFMKKHRLLDEEKRLRRQELRMSRHYVEALKSQEVPFGIRAIQSGIQIDGIWISRDTSPASSEHRVPSLMVLDSSESSTALPSPQRTSVAETSPQAVPEPLHRGRLEYRQSERGELIYERKFGFGNPSTDTSEQRDSGSKYKPRRSSRLRFGTYGEYHEEALDQLEGRMPFSQTGNTENLQDSIYADAEYGLPLMGSSDNERRQGSSSNESDSRPCSSTIDQARLQHQSTPQYSQNRDVDSKAFGILPPNRVNYRSFPLQKPGSEYSVIPFSAAEEDNTTNPFVTPPSTPLDPEQHDETQMQQFQNRWRGPEVTLLPRMPYPAPFIPGELHVNRMVRRVNSGFEILPAGTFGAPAKPVDSFAAVDIQEARNASMEPRRPNKLQKKRRSSSTVRRTSSTYGTS